MNVKSGKNRSLPVGFVLVCLGELLNVSIFVHWLQQLPITRDLPSSKESDKVTPFVDVNQ